MGILRPEKSMIGPPKSKPTASSFSAKGLTNRVLEQPAPKI
jgi:hypothetical protein